MRDFETGAATGGMAATTCVFLPCLISTGRSSKSESTSGSFGFMAAAAVRSERRGI